MNDADANVMSETTEIQWANSTFNPWIGCTKVSPGCAKCYAETLDRNRFSKTLGGASKENPVSHWGKGAPRYRTSASAWKNPPKWNREASYFPALCPKCACVSEQKVGAKCIRDFKGCDGVMVANRPRIFPSLCDWLDDEVPLQWLSDFIGLIDATPNLDWLLLTKRPEIWEKQLFQIKETHTVPLADRPSKRVADKWLNGEPPENVWFGVSVEDQQRADERIPQLLQIPAKVRFLSVEPLLSPVDLTSVGPNSATKHIYQNRDPYCNGGFVCNALTGEMPYYRESDGEPCIDYGNTIDWVIVGGESGKNARPCNVEWIRSIVRQSKGAGVPCFVKQVGSNAFVDPCPNCGHPEESHGMGRTVGCQHGDGSEQNPICSCRKMRGEIAHGYGWPMSHHPVKHPKGGDMEEWPEDLRVREFPL